MAAWSAAVAALSLGVLTSISPCPLAGNVAAISFISRSLGSRPRSLLSGLLYTLGRMAAYVGLGLLVMGSVLGSDQATRWLDRYLNQLLGPVLVIVGVLLSGLVRWGASLSLVGPKLQGRVSRGPLAWSAVLGMALALSFCPVSAGLFFGGLLSLAATHKSPLLLPCLYGVGTALPVLVFSILIATGSRYLGKAFGQVSLIERWGRALAGAAFILAGVYYCLTYIYGLSLLNF